jgi:glyoxylate reductase
VTPRIVTTLALPQFVLRLLGEVGTVHGPGGWEEALGEAEALLPLLRVRVDRALLERAPRLRVVACPTVGYDHVDVAACRERGMVVTHAPDVLTEATADLTWALLLATVRRLPQAERSLRAGEFRGWGFWDYLGGDLTGRVLGIFGMGRIGRAVARRAAPFGMRVRYHSRTRLSAGEERSLGAEWVGWDELLETSDVLTLHAPLTPETRHLLDRDALRRMKPGSYLVNTARGPLVDEAALVEALREGPLAGAGLDVYEREPEIHPGLLELDNVVLLPHVGSATRETRTRMAILAAENVRAVLSGGAPLTPVP